MKVNLYDFDGTIYDGDSTIDFYLFCLKKKASIIKFLPVFIFYILLYKLNLRSKEEMKEKFYMFLNSFDNIDSLVLEFWKNNDKKIKKFYLENEHNKDVIISASPEFLLKPICKKMKVKKLIASKVDKNTGKYIGYNCYGEEKVRRLNNEFKNIIVDNVYSDSYNDLPILKLGKNSFLVDGKKVILIDKDELIKIKNDVMLKVKKVLNLLFILSVPFVSLLLCGNYDLKYLKLLVIFSFVLGIFIKRKVIGNSIYVNIDFRCLIFSFLFSFYSVGILSSYSEVGITWINKILDKFFAINYSVGVVRAFISVLALPSIVVIVYFFSRIVYQFIKKEFSSFSKMEKQFLIIVGIGGLILTTIIYNKTNVFYYPIHNGNYSGCDIIYTTDSGLLNYIDTYMKVGAAENDLRQPLFGLFALPFAVIAKFISSFLNFIPNSYYIVFNVIQMLLLAISLIFIERMLGLKKINKVLFLMLSLSTFSVILFSFVYEQYIIALFYLILTLYIWFFYKKDVNYCYVGAVGTLLTSGIILPVITREKISNFSNYMENIFKCFICFVTVSVLSGQILMSFEVVDKLTLLMRFSGKGLLFVDKLKQFLYFVSSIFIAPIGKSGVSDGVYRYKLIDIDFISVFGILIILLCFASFIINRKNIFARISFMWIIFSFVILCLVGWGTQENGLILYSLYFFWAYVSLIFLLINKIKNNKLKMVVYVLLVLVMLYFNLSEFIRIVQFGISHYYN